MGKIDILRERKKELNITFEELAQKSGIPLRTLENIFHGVTKNPRIDTMQAIERALGLDNDKNPSGNELSEGEAELLELFNRVPEDKKELVLQMIQTAVKNL